MISSRSSAQASIDDARSAADVKTSFIINLSTTDPSAPGEFALSQNSRSLRLQWIVGPSRAFVDDCPTTRRKNQGREISNSIESGSRYERDPEHGSTRW